MSRDTGPTSAVRDLVNARAQFRCERCGDRNGPFAHHHRRPRAAGGSRRDDTNSPVNLVLLCDYNANSCHRQIESHRRNALDDGWLLRQSQDPALVPVLIGGALVYLTADGGYDPVMGDVA